MTETVFLSPSRQDRVNSAILAVFGPLLFLIALLLVLVAPQPTAETLFLAALSAVGAAAALIHHLRVCARPVNDDVPLIETDESLLRACVRLADREAAAADYVRRHGPLTYARLPELLAELKAVDCA